jgi:hypothetical protein
MKKAFNLNNFQPETFWNGEREGREMEKGKASAVATKKLKHLTSRANKHGASPLSCHRKEMRIFCGHRGGGLILGNAEMRFGMKIAGVL